MIFNELSPDLRKKVKACTTPEEIIALAKAEGYKLSDEELGAISGGDHWYDCNEDIVFEGGV